MARLKVFKNQYMSDLEHDIEKNIDKYVELDEQFFSGDESAILQSSYEISDMKPVLRPDMENDIDNAIYIYEYLHIDNTAASDPRLWTYLAHVQFCDYVIKRWNIKTDDIKKIHERFFLNGNARSLRRHAIARLWWATKLTTSPWETAKELLPLKKEDKYYYTRVLMKDESLASDITERPQLSASPIMLIGTLEFLDRHPEYNGRTFRRELLKELILTLGYRKLMLLDLDSFLTELNDIAFEIERRFKLDS